MDVFKGNRSNKNTYEKEVLYFKCQELESK